MTHEVGFVTLRLGSRKLPSLTAELLGKEWEGRKSPEKPRNLLPSPGGGGGKCDNDSS